MIPGLTPTTQKEKVQEILRCGKDPVYFVNNYIKIQTTTAGTIAFKTFDFQDDCIRAFLEHRFNIVVKSRQLGLSTISAAYALWMAMFHKDKNILVIATKLPTAVNFIKKVKFMLNSIPKWLSLAEYRDTQQSIVFSNGSEIKAIPTSEDAGRSEALSLLVVDEAAIIKNFDDIWAGLYPTLSTGGSAILISTPKGVGGTYYKIYADAVAGVNNFNHIRLPWHVHPDRDEEWFREDSKQFSGDLKKIGQEYLCVGEQSRIVTPAGFKLARDILVDDLVLTQKGRFRKVLDTHIRELATDEQLYSVSIPGCRKSEVLITGDHPVLSYRVPIKNDSPLDKIKEQFENVPSEFITVTELAKRQNSSEGILCGLFPKFDRSNYSNNTTLIDLSKFSGTHNITEKTCKYKNQLGSTRRYVDLDFDAGRFIGLFLVEGWSHADGGFDLGFHIKEKETLAKFCCDFMSKLEVKNTIHEEGNECRVYSSNKFMTFLFSEFVEGRYANEKCLRFERLLETNEEFVKGIVIGYHEGDRLHDYDNKTNIISNSEKLVYQLKIILSMWGHHHKIGKIDYSDQTTASRYYLEIDDVNGVDIGQSLNSFENELYSSRARYVGNSLFVGNPSFSLISNDDPRRNTRVVDLKVDEDKTFVVESLIVHNCDFVSSGDTFLQVQQMDWLKSLIRDPLEKTGDGRKVWVWEYARSNKKYIITADVSRGDSTDHSAFHVIETDTATIVAEFKGKIPPDRLGQLLVEWAIKYNNALICPEHNTYGFMTCSEITKLKYSKLYYKNARYAENYVPKEGDKPGFDTQSNSKIQALTKLEELIRNQVLKSFSQRLVDELSTFVWNGSKASALKGYNDDLVMSIAIGSWLLDSMYGGPNDGSELKDLMARSIVVSRRSFSEIAPDVPIMGGGPSAVPARQRQMGQAMFNHDGIDLKWLLDK